MINAQLKLVILVFDTSIAKYKLFSSEESSVSLPSRQIEPFMDINSHLEHLLDSCIDGKNIHHNFKLTDIVALEELCIYYIVFIMHETSLKHGSLVPFDPKTNRLDLPANAEKIVSLL